MALIKGVKAQAANNLPISPPVLWSSVGGSQDDFACAILMLSLFFGP